MKFSWLIALAILPCVASGAQAHGGHARHVRFHHRAFSYSHHHHGSGAGRMHVGVLHDRGTTLPEQREALKAMVTRSAIEHGLPPSLAHGIVRVESGYRCSANNHGAAGIMQIKPATARSVGISGGLNSCATGLEAGMRYLREAYLTAHGNAAYAATLYNRGLGARPARSGYSRTVMRMSSL